MAQTQSQQLSIFIDMFLEYRKTFGKNPQKLFYEGWSSFEDNEGIVLSYQGELHYPKIFSKSEYADTFIAAISSDFIEQEEPKKPERICIEEIEEPKKNKPKATTLPFRTYQQHLSIKQNAATK